MALSFPEVRCADRVRHPSWLHETIVRFWSTFSSPRLVSVGSVGDTVDGDRIEHVPVEGLAEGRAAFALESNHWPKCLECLDYSLEADCSRFDAVFSCRLSRDRTDEIGQDMRPEFLSDKCRCLASHDVHLQRFFQ